MGVVVCKSCNVLESLKFGVGVAVSHNVWGCSLQELPCERVVIFWSRNVWELQSVGVAVFVSCRVLELQ